MELPTKKNHYLHPDFEDIDKTCEKKPSPLALLAQTCKNIGSITNSGVGFFHDINRSPNHQHNSSKRCLSDCSSNSCSSTDIDNKSPNKKSRLEQKLTRKTQLEIVELKSADTSSETGSSFINSLIQFVKNSNSAQLIDADKMQLLHFLAGQINDKEEKHNATKLIDYSSKGNQFNVEKGYHLDTIEEAKLRNYSPQTHSPTITLENTKVTSAIKYCMYCGQLIPILPMLLAHIRMQHGSFDFPDGNFCNASSNPAVSNAYDILSKFNPYISSSPVKSNPTFSFLTDFMNSSFQGQNNLIC